MNNNKEIITKFVLERTKMSQNKKKTKKQKTVFLRQSFLFDCDFNNIYFDLPYSFYNTQTSTNLRPNLSSLRVGALDYQSSTSFRYTFSTWLNIPIRSTFILFQYGTSLQRKNNVLREIDQASDQWLHLRPWKTCQK